MVNTDACAGAMPVSNAAVAASMIAFIEASFARGLDYTPLLGSFHWRF